MPAQAWKRLFAADITGRKAGEADAIEKGLFVHPEENIQLLRKQSKWQAGAALVLLPPLHRGSSCSGVRGVVGRGSLSTLGLLRAGDRLAEHMVK